MKPILILSLAFLLTACPGRRYAEDRPRPDTAIVGVKLDELERSIGGARGDLGGVQASLSDVDAKAVRIQEAIRKW